MKNIILHSAFVALFLISFQHLAFAQRVSGMPSLPTGGMGLQGSAGVGFFDITSDASNTNFDVDRGNTIAVGIERGFDILHLYLTLGFSYATAEGTANYNYTSSSTTYSITGVDFDSSFMDLSLGLKLKLIDGYWFRPYVEGGGLAGYHQLTYTSKKDVMAGIGSDYKTKENVMGSGYYGEGGIEAMFSEKFGVKLAARKSWYNTKEVETLGNQALRFTSETYYFAALFGF